MNLTYAHQSITELTHEGRTFRRNPDATFTVPDDIGKRMLRGGEFARAGMTPRGMAGYRCGDCGFLAVFADHCGRCGGTDLTRED